MTTLRGSKEDGNQKPLEPGSALKNEVLQLLEDDRRLKNMRFEEVHRVIEANKNM